MVFAKITSALQNAPKLLKHKPPVSALPFSEARELCEKTFQTMRRENPTKLSPTRMMARHIAMYERHMKKAETITDATLRTQTQSTIQKRHDKLNAIASKGMKQLEALRSKKPGDEAYLKEGIHNCGECTGVAARMLEKQKVPFQAYSLHFPTSNKHQFERAGDHMLIVANTPSGFKLNKPKTHSGEEVLFDPQNGIWKPLQAGLDESLGLFGVNKGAKPTRNYGKISPDTYYFDERDLQ